MNKVLVDLPEEEYEGENTEKIVIEKSEMFSDMAISIPDKRFTA